MASSDVDICNLALQKLGAARINALTDDSRNARALNACYTQIRDRELRAHPWTFAIQRFILAPLSVAPAFTYLYAFPVPTGFLRLLLPPHFDLDWKLENQNGQHVILTNDGTTLNVRCIIRVTDPTLFDPAFDEALACKLAWHTCEQITQSNEKKKDAAAEYKESISEARKLNAIERRPDEAPADSWDVARLFGGNSDFNFIRSTHNSGID